MPGHKGSSFFTRLGYDGSLASADFDITEIPGADDLRKAEGVIRAISDRYSDLYGSRRSFISVNGSSAPIMAAVMSQIGRGRKIIAASDSHISVKNGIELAGAEAVYVDPERLPWGNSLEKAPCEIGSNTKDQDTKGLPGGVSADVIAEALDENKDADAVILPSPNYFGVVSDIKRIAEEVHRCGKVLIVDQAHGAHLKMFARAGLCDRMPEPAEDLGADIVIDSTHKTMASFTQSAVCHVFGDRVDPGEYEKALLMLESTSPSYLLMNSLAVNADIMERHGDELARSWRSDLDFFYDNVKEIRGIDVLTRDIIRPGSEKYCGYMENVSDFDETKIVVDFSRAGTGGEEAEKALIEEGIYPEFHTDNLVMFLTGIGNIREDYEALIEAFSRLTERK